MIGLIAAYAAHRSQYCEREKRKSQSISTGYREKIEQVGIAGKSERCHKMKKASIKSNRSKLKYGVEIENASHQAGNPKAELGHTKHMNREPAQRCLEDMVIGVVMSSKDIP